MKRINPGECLPFGYGIIYYDAPRDQRVACWFPFNLILRGMRELWYFLAIPRRSRLEKAEREIKRKYRVDYARNEKRIDEEVNRRIGLFFDKAINKRLGRAFDEAVKRSEP